MIKRIVALSFIVICTSVAWLYLAAAMNFRTNDKSETMTDAVGGLWGTPHGQAAPMARIEWEVEQKTEMTEQEKAAYIAEKQEEENLKAKRQRRRPRRVEVPEEEFFKVVKEPHEREVSLKSSDVKVDLDLEHRQKGLLWFATYKVDFNADYGLENPVEYPAKVTMVFPFPSVSAVYDNLKIEAQGVSDLEYRAVMDTHSAGDPMIATFTLPPQAKQKVKFRYQSRGLDQWTYRFGDNSEMVENFKLTMNTNFDDVDFPRNSISPDKKTKKKDGAGWTLEWDKESLVSAFQIGMVMPTRLNPGPLASSMSGHAPVSLVFFFFVIFLLQVLKGIKIHPMNYFFLAASFFSFNLLFGYLVDHLSLHWAFAISSAVSIFLVVSYLKVAVGARFAIIEAGISQFIFQILFAFAHFFEGYTGLAITIGAILTLAAVMHLTARLDWEAIFKDKTWSRMASTNIGGPSIPPPMPAGQTPEAG